MLQSAAEHKKEIEQTPKLHEAMKKSVFWRFGFEYSDCLPSLHNLLSEATKKGIRTSNPRWQ